MIWRMWYIIPKVLGCADLKDRYSCAYCRGKGAITDCGDYASVPPGWGSSMKIPPPYLKGGKFGRRIRVMCPVCQGTGFIDWVQNVRVGEEHPNAHVRRWPLEYMSDVMVVLSTCLMIWGNKIKKNYSNLVTEESKKR